MEEFGVLLLVLLILALPVGMVVLLLVYVSKTNTLRREVDMLTSDIQWIRRRLGELASQAQTQVGQSQPVRPPEPIAPYTQSLPSAVRPLEPFRSPGVHPPPPVQPEPRVPSARPPFSPPPPPSSQPTGPVPPERSHVPPSPSTPAGSVPRPPVSPWQPSTTAGAAPPMRPPSPPYRPPVQPVSQAERAFLQPPPPASRTRAEWESLIGGRWLRSIGAVALVIAFGFLFKYAYDHHWISQWGVVSIGFVVGLLLVVLGWRFHRKDYAIFAQGLFGAGIGILYLSVYAAFNYYHLVAQPVAFVMMWAVTILTFAVAVSYDSLAVALLGWVGGTITPWLLSTGQANEVGLFTHIAVLDAGLLTIVAFKRSWVILEPLTLGATYTWYLIWYQKFYQPDALLVTVVFLTIFWLIFFALDTYRMVTGETDHAEVGHAVAAFSGIFYYAALYTIIDRLHHELMGVATLLVGLVYFTTIVAASLQKRVLTVYLARYLLSSILMLVLATSIQFTGFTTVTYWSIEAAALVACGLYFELPLVSNSALALFAIAFGKLVLTPGALAYAPIEEFRFGLNQRSLAYATLAVAMAASSVMLRRFRRNDAEAESVPPAVLEYGWSFLLFGLITVEVNDFFRMRVIGKSGNDVVSLEFNRFLAIGSVWVAYSLALVRIGLQKRLTALLISGLGALVLAAGVLGIGALEFEPISDFRPGLNFRAYALVFGLIALFTQTRWLQRQENYPGARWFAGGMIFGWCAVLFALLTSETSDYFRYLSINASGADLTMLAFRRDMILVMIWSALSVAFVWRGLRKATGPLLYSGLALAGLAVAMAMVRGSVYEPLERFTMAANYRSAALACLIAAIVFHTIWLRRNSKGFEWLGGFAESLRIIGALLIIHVMTVETNDYFRLQRLTASGPDLTALGFERDMIFVMIWAVLSVAFVWWALRRSTAPLLYTGLGLAVVVVAFAAFRGIEFKPVERFSLLLNFRAAALAFAIAALVFHTIWTRRAAGQFSGMAGISAVLRIVVALLIFHVATAETRDFFEKGIEIQDQSFSLSAGPAGAIGAEITRLTNLKQMWISLVWLSYSILLMVYGILRKAPALRILAIILFGISILKIFIYDLSFLETLYRIFSFMVLGLILLAVSYLYQRYKSVIFDVEQNTGVQP